MESQVKRPGCLTLLVEALLGGVIGGILGSLIVRWLNA